MKAVGKNTAIKVKVVAITASPISSAASMAAWYGDLPMRKWRTMFSTSTMASSTKMPTTSDKASRVTTLMEKPKACMPMKAGITDKGRATAVTKVARQSRKNNHTTNTAKMAPSYSRCKEPWYSSATGETKSKASVNSMSGWAARNSARAFCTAAPTSISLAPRLRETSKPTTGWPLSRAAERGSATVSCTWATWSKRMRRPSAKVNDMRDKVWASVTVPRVRTGCSPPATSVRPPELSDCICLSWREISAALAPSACRRCGSKAMWICRSTPPTRLTAPTPRTASNLRAIWLSTNHDKASASILAERNV